MRFSFPKFDSHGGYEISFAPTLSAYYGGVEGMSRTKRF